MLVRCARVVVPLKSCLAVSGDACFLHGLLGHLLVVCDAMQSVLSEVGHFFVQGTWIVLKLWSVDGFGLAQFDEFRPRGCVGFRHASGPAGPDVCTLGPTGPADDIYVC